MRGAGRAEGWHDLLMNLWVSRCSLKLPPKSFEMHTSRVIHDAFPASLTLTMCGLAVSPTDIDFEWKN